MTPCAECQGWIDPPDMHERGCTWEKRNLARLAPEVERRVAKYFDLGIAPVRAGVYGIATILDDVPATLRVPTLNEILTGAP